MYGGNHELDGLRLSKFKQASWYKEEATTTILDGAERLRRSAYNLTK